MQWPISCLPEDQVRAALLAHGPKDLRQLTLRVPGYTEHSMHMQEAPGRDQDSLYIKEDNTFAAVSSACSTAQQHNIHLSRFPLKKKGADMI